jgi:RHS repeat-associated protein
MLLILLSLVLQWNVSGNSVNIPQENCVQKTLTSENNGINGGNDWFFRYQGQYEDSETGLYYNRFRYYDPDSGNYLSQDPIGLAGNNPTLYGYVSNSNLEVDVFGLDFMNLVNGSIQRTSKKYHGAEIYKFNSKVEVDGVTFKKGDYFYLDNFHKDHYETFSKMDESKGVFNLDGTLNEDKSKKSKKRKGPGCG